MNLQKNIYSDLINKYQINPDVFSPLSAHSSQGFFAYALVFLDEEKLIHLGAEIGHEEDIETSGEKVPWKPLIEKLYNYVSSPYDKERFMRSLTLKNLRKRFVERNDYSFMVSIIDLDGAKRMFRLVFEVVNREKNIVLWSFQDITKTLECDVLTGGLNRQGLLRNMEACLARNKGKEFAILYFNIAGLRRVNEFYGTEVGDLLLQHFYAAMAYSELQPDSYARSHSDSYYCLVRKERVDTAVIEKLCHQDFKYGDKMLHYRLVCGIYYIQDYSEPVTSLLGRARLALRYVKDPLKKPWVILDEEMRRHCISDSEVVDQLDYALLHNEFVAYYQPIVNVKTERIEMAEALVRWNSSRYGFVAPNDFVPSLERNGEISRVDKFMEDHIYQIQSERLKKGKTVVPIDINLSWVDFEDKTLVDQITKHLADHVVGNQDLCRYEITESTIGELTENNHLLLEAFKNNRAKLIIDDFGKGYSFGTMSEIDFNIIKIDKSLVDNIGSKKADFLIESLINMFHKMNAKIVAEGVERLSQVEYLRSVGCDYIQGYYYFKPMPEDKFFALLDEHSADTSTYIDVDQSNNSMWMERDVLEAQYAKLMQASESASRLRDLLDEMGLYYFEWDIKTHIDTCGERFRQMYGLPSTEIPNMPEVADLCLPEDRDRFREFYYRAERGEQSGTDYFRILEPSGKGYSWFRKTFFTLFDKDRKPYKVILTMQNCTDKYNYRALSQCNDLLINLQGVLTFKYTVDDDMFEFTRVSSDGVLHNVKIPNYLSASDEELDARDSKNQRLLEPKIREKLADPFKDPVGYVDFTDGHTQTDMRAYYTVVESEFGNVYAIVGHAENILKTREKLNETIQKQQEYITVVDGLRKIYNGISYADLVTGQSKVILVDSAYGEGVTYQMSWCESARSYSENIILPEYKQAFMDFMEIKTVGQRLDNSPYISLEYKDKVFGWIRGYIMPSERDESGKVTRVMFASLPIGNEKSVMERLIFLSETDGLTQLYNRMSGERYIEKALKSKEPGTFAIIDCDKFKLVNDTFGHAVGDQVLIEVANCLKRMNPYGINVRLGGDEFAMYINGAMTTEKILDLFEDMFRKVKGIEIDVNDEISGIRNEKITPTVSVGAVCYSGTRVTNFDALYRTADALLYQSKKAEGCRVTL